MKSIPTMIVTGLLATGSLCLSSPALAGPKQLNRYHVDVDGHALRVVTSVDGSVKVMQGGVFGSAQSIQLRDRMRRAVTAATHCTIADDFFLDGKLVGKLDCQSVTANAAGGVGSQQ